MSIEKQVFEKTWSEVADWPITAETENLFQAAWQNWKNPKQSITFTLASTEQQSSLVEDNDVVALMKKLQGSVV